MERDAAKLRANVGRTLWLGFFRNLLLIMPVAVPFFQSKGLSMQEVFSCRRCSRSWSWSWKRRPAIWPT